MAIKVSLNEGTPPLLSSGIRFLIAGLILWVVFYLRQETLPLNRTAIIIYLQYAVLNFTVSYGITYWATQFVYSNISSLVWAGFPFTVALLAHLSLPDDRLSTGKALSILAGTIGVIIILTQGQELGDRHMTMGIIMLIIAVIIAAGPAVYLKKHSHVVNTVQLNAVSQTLAGILLLLLSLAFESREGIRWSTENLIAIGYLATFGSVIVWLIYFWLFSHITVTQISYVAFFPPMIATFMGWILLDEALTPLTILGGFMVLSGALWINLSVRRKKSHLDTDTTTPTISTHPN